MAASNNQSDVSASDNLGGQPAKSVPELRELGGTGLQHDAGKINEEIIKQLEWPRNIKVYKEMETDAIVSAALFYIKNFIRSSKWSVQPYDGPDMPANAEAQRRFVEECFDDLDKPWPEVMTDILSFLPYGFSVHEIVFKRRGGLKTNDPRFRSKYNDGYYGIRKLPIRSQDTIEDWDISPQGELRAVRQMDTWNGIDVWIPKEKFLLFRTTAYKDNPMGQSILRSAYRAYHNRSQIEILEGIGFERNLAGVPVAKLPAEYMSADATPAQQQLYRMMQLTVSNVRKNSQAGVVFPSDPWNTDTGSGGEMFSFELLKGGTTGSALETNTAIERWDRRIAMSMASDFILMGGQSVGSYSLASSKVIAFTTAIGSYLDIIAAQINDKLIPMLFEANGWDSSKTPKFTHNGVENVDLEVIGKFLADAAKGGFVTPSDDLENMLREEYLHLPPLQEESAMDRARRSAEMEGMTTEATSNDTGVPDGIPNLIPEQ